MEGHAICPFCDDLIIVGGIEFGGSVLHDSCYTALQVVMQSFDSLVEREQEADPVSLSEMELIPF